MPKGTFVSPEDMSQIFHESISLFSFQYLVCLGLAVTPFFFFTSPSFIYIASEAFFLFFFALIIPLAGLGLVFDEFQGIVHWLHYRGK